MKVFSRDEFASPDLDDVIVYSIVFKEHVEHIRSVLQKLRAKGVKVKAKKCNLFKRELAFVGRIVNEDGYRMDLSNIKAITLFLEKPPETVGELRRLLGMLGQFRRHIQDYSRIAKPLFQLLTNKEDHSGQVSSKTNIVLGKTEKKLIGAVTTHPILAYPDFEKPFQVHVDASESGLGAILYQDVDTNTKVINYASRTLNPAEQKYHSGKLEFLALKWCITEAFHEYLYYADECTVFTDNNPLTYVMTTGKLNAVGQRWVNNLANYKFQIKYRPGVVHKDADCLSRFPLDIEQYRPLCTETVDQDVMSAVTAEVNKTDDISISSLLIEENGLLHVTMPSGELSSESEIDEMYHSVGNHVEDRQILDIKKLQEEDSHIREVIGYMVRDRKPSAKETRGCSKTVKQILKQWSKLKMNQDDVLCRMVNHEEQIVLPEQLKGVIYTELHEKMGHLGPERVYDLAKERFYWPYMKQEIAEQITQKCSCLINKKPSTPPYASLQSIQSTAPLDIVGIDLLHLEESSGGFEYILTITDHFTKFAQAYPLRNTEAKTVAKVLYFEFMQRFGAPRRLLHDQGKEFENRLFHQLQEHMGVERLRTTPYHPPRKWAMRANERDNSSNAKNTY